MHLTIAVIKVNIKSDFTAKINIPFYSMLQLHSEKGALLPLLYRSEWSGMILELRFRSSKRFTKHMTILLPFLEWWNSAVIPFKERSENGTKRNDSPIPNLFQFRRTETLDVWANFLLTIRLWCLLAICQKVYNLESFTFSPLHNWKQASYPGGQYC